MCDEILVILRTRASCVHSYIHVCDQLFLAVTEQPYNARRDILQSPLCCDAREYDLSRSPER
jgi:hypothetical protein